MGLPSPAEARSFRRIDAGAEIIDEFIFGGGKRDRVNHGVVDSHLGNHLVEPGAAPLIARFANQQDGAALMTLPALQHVDGVVDSINGGRMEGTARLESR